MCCKSFSENKVILGMWHKGWFGAGGGKAAQRTSWMSCRTAWDKVNPRELIQLSENMKLATVALESRPKSRAQNSLLEEA